MEPQMGSGLGGLRLVSEARFGCWRLCVQDEPCLVFRMRQYAGRSTPSRPAGAWLRVRVRASRAMVRERPRLRQGSACSMATPPLAPGPPHFYLSEQPDAARGSPGLGQRHPTPPLPTRPPPAARRATEGPPRPQPPPRASGGGCGVLAGPHLVHRRPAQDRKTAAFKFPSVMQVRSGRPM
jgi:hypothetical protein